jgi:hypothetical protein
MSGRLITTSKKSYTPWNPAVRLRVEADELANASIIEEKKKEERRRRGDPGEGKRGGMSDCRRCTQLTHSPPSPPSQG